jgi:two-component system sensor histidine kinase KdpD
MLPDSDHLSYNERVERSFVNLRWAGYVGAVFGTLIVSGLLAPFHEQINTTTVGLAFLLVVLFVALFWGSRPALLASVLAMFCFNFFFLPPLYTLSIAHSQNWVALTAFFTTALVVGQLSARAKRRAEEAEAGRREIERLYQELQAAFERASQAEALKQSERLKSALLDAVTHDLRTPLTSIKASVTTLLEELRTRNSDDGQVNLTPEGRKEMLEVINEEADRLDHFIEGLMELARIEAGEIRLRRQWGSVEEILRAALTRATPLTRHHQIETFLDDELPSVRVDERAVAEVVYTLIDNAAKYSPAGTCIRVSATSDNDGTVKLTVEDEGPGIPDALRDRVFDKFFRAMRDGDSAASKPVGSGMGLAIAKGIVEAHDGRISIEDARGNKGTKVVVILPTGD